MIDEIDSEGSFNSDGELNNDLDDILLNDEEYKQGERDTSSEDDSETSTAELDKIDNFKENSLQQSKNKIEDVPYILITGEERNSKNNFITKFEYANLIGRRAEDIENSNPGPHEITKNDPVGKTLSFSLDIAKFELDNPDIPFPYYLLRRMNIGTFPIKYEVWDVRELTLPWEIVNGYKLTDYSFKIPTTVFKSDI